MHRKQTILHLFGSFFRVGAFTFGGGYAMLALIEREVVERRKWVERDDFLELLALAQSAPGPISLNVAVFVGYRVGGYVGAAAALLGVVIPAFAIILFIAIYFSEIRSNTYVNAAFMGMRPAVVALIVAPLFNLVRGMQWWKIAAAIAAAVIVWFLGVSPICILSAGAVAGMVCACCKKVPAVVKKDEEA